MNQIKPLTGIRGIAALWVVMFHLNEINNSFVPGPIGNIFRHGYLAVDLFFILSGFVMSMSYRELFASRFSIRHYATFLIRRLARIYPLYVATTLLVLVIGFSGIGHHRVDTHFLASILIANLALIQAWGFTDTLNGPAWSISTEFAAYLIFPVLLTLLFKSSKRVATSIVLLCIGTIVYISTIPSPGDLAARWGPLHVAWAHSAWPLVRCIAEFSIGLAAFRLAQNKSMKYWAARPVCGYAVAACIALLSMFRFADAALVCLFACLIIVLAVRQDGVASIFGASITFFLGEVSYAVYLLHWPLIRVQQMTHAALLPRLGPTLAEIGSTAVFFAVLIFTSWGAYVLLERPARRWMRRLEQYVDVREVEAVAKSERAGNQSLLTRS